jgi:hypothetical protein
MESAATRLVEQVNRGAQLAQTRQDADSPVVPTTPR